MKKLLLADDDPQILSLLSEYLSAQNFAVTSVENGQLALDAFHRYDFDLILLDIMMPIVDGIEALTNIRRSSTIPVIMLTAKNEDLDRILGLELGADDYIAKPYHPREVVARINAVLRRATPVKHDLKLNDLTLDHSLRAAQINGVDLALTTAEFSVLQSLIENREQPVTRESLTQSALNRPLTAFDRAIDVHISNLRRKIARTSNHFLIKNIRGQGYQIIHSDLGQKK